MAPDNWDDPTDPICLRYECMLKMMDVADFSMMT